MSNLNPEKIAGTMQIRYPGKKIFMLPEDHPTEILCEIEPTEAHPEYSAAISVLGESVPHKHNGRTEVYTVLDGTLAVYLGVRATERIISLNMGQSLIIEPGTVHRAASSDEAWIHVYSFPGWKPEDHIIVDPNTGEEHVRQ